MVGAQIVALLKEHRDATNQFIGLLMDDPSVPNTLNLISQLSEIVEELDALLVEIETSDSPRP